MNLFVVAKIASALIAIIGICALLSTVFHIREFDVISSAAMAAAGAALYVSLSKRKEKVDG